MASVTAAPSVSEAEQAWLERIAVTRDLPKRESAQGLGSRDA